MDFEVTGVEGRIAGSNGWPNFLSITDAVFIPRGISHLTTAKEGNLGSHASGLSSNKASLQKGITPRINFAFSEDSGTMYSLKLKPAMPDSSNSSFPTTLPDLFLNSRGVSTYATQTFSLFFQAFLYHNFHVLPKWKVKSISLN